MATHYHVADITTDGLQDNCSRCEELADHPLERLDDAMLRALYLRINAKSGSRSANEAWAMRNLSREISRAQKLRRLGMLGREEDDSRLAAAASDVLPPDLASTQGEEGVN